jgi:hypothetical protein
MMRRLALALVILGAAGAALAELPDQCNARRFASWTGVFPTVQVKEKGAWIAGARAKGQVCVTDGNTFRWLPQKSVKIGAVPTMKRRPWVGSWTRKPSGEGDVEGNFLILAKDDFLVVKGDASWRAKFKDSLVHRGDISDAAQLHGNVLQLGDATCLDSGECDACVARLVFINGRLLVSDNRKCGGMNVVFDGVYARASKLD